MADSLRPRFQSFTDSILSHRVSLYTFASTLAVSATVVNALQNQSNFYSVAVYLSKSGASVLVASSCVLSLQENLPSFFPQVLANFSLLLALMCGRLVQQLFFGSLRVVEVEVGLEVFSHTEPNSLTETLRPHVVLCHRVTFSIHHFQR
jgi:E3 ubiquitin-protein ligase synoviolin